MVIIPDSPKEKTLTDLPESYTGVQPVAVQVKKSNPEVTEIFRVLSSPQDTVSEEQCRVLERFRVVMYSLTLTPTRKSTKLENSSRSCTAHQKSSLSGRSCMGSSAGANAGTPKSGRVRLAAITRRLVSQVDYAS